MRGEADTPTDKSENREDEMGNDRVGRRQIGRLR